MNDEIGSQDRLGRGGGGKLGLRPQDQVSVVEIENGGGEDEGGTGGEGAETGELLRTGNLTQLICGSFLLLWMLPAIFMNERRMARIVYVLDRGSKECLANVPISIRQKHNTNYKLVHCIGKNNTEEPVKDEQFAVTLD